MIDEDRSSFSFNVYREPDLKQLRRVWKLLEEDGYSTPYNVDFIRTLMDHYERTHEDADPPSYEYECGGCGCGFDDHDTSSDFDGHLAYVCPVCRVSFVDCYGDSLPTDDVEAAIEQADDYQIKNL